MEKLKETLVAVWEWGIFVCNMVIRPRLGRAVLCQFKYDFGYSMFSRKFLDVCKKTKRDKNLDQFMNRYFEGVGMQLAPLWLEYLEG